MLQYHFIVVCIYVVSLAVEPIGLHHIQIVVTWLLLQFLHSAVLLDLNHAKVVEATTEQSALFLMLEAQILHARLQVQVLILDLMVLVLKRFMLVFVCICLHLHLIFKGLLNTLLCGCCLLVFLFDSLLQFKNLCLEFQLFCIPLVLQYFMLRFQLF